MRMCVHACVRTMLSLHIISLLSSLDEHTHYQSADEEVCPQDVRGGSLPNLRDIPLSEVCEMLYLDDT